MALKSALTLKNVEKELVVLDSIELETLKANREKENTAFLILKAEKENTKNAIEDLKNQANESAKIFEE